MQETDPDLPSLDTMPCHLLKGVGPKLAARLAQYGIVSLQDLLFHLPLRYQDRTRITPMRQLRFGEHAVIEGTITATRTLTGKKPIFCCRLMDESGEIELRFFHVTSAQKQTLAMGTRLRCYGEVRHWASEWVMIHPEYQRMTSETLHPVSAALTPIYPSTEGVPQRTWLALTDQALACLASRAGLVELLPPTLCEVFRLSDLSTAVAYVHRPPPDAAQAQLEARLHPAQRRLAFEELLAHHLSLRRLRLSIQQHLAPALSHVGHLRTAFLAQLPFRLTGAQERVIQELQDDMVKNHPMLRLVQGDVGSGKTIVAALAMLQAVASGYQAVLMAPTELLAEQHYQNFLHWLTPLGVTVIWLSGKSKGKTRTQVLTQLATGEAAIAIGTHALFQKEVQFAKLGLVIIDEQHRFGVHQRLALREKAIQTGIYPHQLIMTATPIPRTLAMTVYADLDTSIIDELPPGRKPVITVAMANHRRAEIIARIRQACAEKRQVYWVCTLIEESEALTCQAAEVTARELTDVLSDCRVGLVHGRLKVVEKQAIMAAFKAGELDVLVATTVIEVGVDVPRASLMIIENPERLGLAQLHQLRGRVGRGMAESHCVLLYQHPLSQQAKARVAVMRETHDGFEIARQDLALRGPGEVLGTRQTGILQLRVADLLRDQSLLPDIEQAATQLLNDAPEAVDPLIRRWLSTKEHYGHV